MEDTPSYRPMMWDKPKGNLMHEELIIEIASGFKDQWEEIYDSYLGGLILVKSTRYEAQLKDDIQTVANAILRYDSAYDIQKFYNACGYPEILGFAH